MPKDAVFTIEQKSSSREYVQQQWELQAYDDCIAQKVEQARQSIRAGEGVSNEDVERMFAALREKCAGKI